MRAYFSTYSCTPGLVSEHFFVSPLKVQLESLDGSGEMATANLKTCAESDKLFAESLSTGDVSDDNDIPVLLNANCKMRAGCRTAASYKNSFSIVCAQHATHDMKPFNPATRQHKQVHEESDTEV